MGYDAMQSDEVQLDYTALHPRRYFQEIPLNFTSNIPIRRFFVVVKLVKRKSKFHREVSRLVTQASVPCGTTPVGTATGYGRDGRGVLVPVPVGARFLSPPRLPGRFWDPFCPLSRGYRGLYPRG
jgi:hypothetical protein